MKVLVTGAKGFIGEWVVKELVKNHHEPVIFSGDVRDKDTFPEDSFGAIIHLASLITHRQVHSKEMFYDVNVQGTKNLLEKYPKTKMVYASTVDITRSPLSVYAETKFAAEKVVVKGNNCVIVRLPSVFGPKQRQVKLITLLFKKYCRGEECIIHNADVREYLYVEDAAGYLVAALDLDGVITLRGSKVSNADLDIMIRTISQGDEITGLRTDEQRFFDQLKQCLPTYQRKMFFDLDGTLIDNKEKSYRVYADILSEAGYAFVTRTEYWNAKRKGVQEIQILARTSADPYYDEYIQKRTELLESDLYLSYDSLHEGVIKTLESLSKKFQLVLVTLRKSRIQLDKQLISLGIKDYFADVLSSGEEVHPRWMVKYNLIKEYIKTESPFSHILIGDTESDIRAGIMLRFKTIAVLNGIRDNQTLLHEYPDLICDTVKDFSNPKMVRYMSEVTL